MLDGFRQRPARPLVPTPPVRWRRGVLALGSGDPARAICSTRIAEALQSIAYPILPDTEKLTEKACERCSETVQEILHIGYHTSFTSRDFDLSPYFEVIKATVEKGFDFHMPDWEVPA